MTPHLRYPLELIHFMYHYITYTPDPPGQIILQVLL